MNISIILAHSDPASFNHAVATWLEDVRQIIQAAFPRECESPGAE